MARRAQTRSTGEAPQCWCFDLCDNTTANEYWAASRGVHLHDRSSPWLRYFAAVYSDAQIPTPFPLHRITYFYHGVRLWYELFPSVHNPFRPCDLPAPTERPSVPSCADSVCAAWRVPLSPPGRQSGDAVSANVSVIIDLLRGNSMEHRRQYGLPDGFHGLPVSRLADLREINRWITTSGLPTADGVDGDGWVEVHRSNVFDRGLSWDVIQEGVVPSRSLVPRAKLRGGSLKGSIPWNRGNITRRPFETNEACFFSPVVGSGIWVQIGDAYLAASRHHGNHWWHTRGPNASASSGAGHGRTRFTFTRGLVPGATRYAVLNLRGNELLDLILGPGAPCASRNVSLGTCPPATMLRTGWRAQQPCACNEGWDFLNCHDDHGITNKSKPTSIVS